jgi:hypothetical protein
MLRGSLYNLANHSHGGDRKSDGSTAQNEQLITTAEKLAEKLDVSPATIRRDGEFAQAVDAIGATCGPEVKMQLLSKSELSKQDVIGLAREKDPEALKAAVQERVQDKRKGQSKKAKEGASAPAMAATITLPRDVAKLVPALLDELGQEQATKVYLLLGKALGKCEQVQAEDHGEPRSDEEEGLAIT